MEESDLMVVGFIENPVELEGETGEIAREVMICLADAWEACDRSAMRLAINSSLAFPSNCWST
jgi:hypothetical protein